MANGPLTAIAYSQNDKIKLDTGKLSVLDNQILQTSGSVRLKADFPNTAPRLWPGELVNVRLLIETRHNTLTVASPAVQLGPQGSYVYVVKADNTVESRPVSVTQLGTGQAVIRSGLKSGEQVVVDGQSRLQPGQRVTILQGTAAEAFTAQSGEDTAIP
jgi:multidrug efflux system membrane fusion protein